MRTCVLMIVFDMCLDVAVADTSVGAVAALGFKSDLAASFTQQKTCKLTVCANITIVETFAAVLTEMEIVIVVLYTDGRRFGAVGIAFTAIQTQLADVAHVHFAEGLAAIGAEMVVPIGIFYTVFAAGAALALGVVDAALGAKSAIGAEFKIGAS